MSPYLPYDEWIDLHVKNRISLEDARRQERTAREIMRRLSDQPGVILADEVGMGKTFVALAVAVSVHKHDPKRRPVTVMVPSSLKEKWPRDFSLFLDHCIPDGMKAEMRSGLAENAESYLKMLDDPLPRRKAVIFITHGALSRGLSDKWVSLALIYQAVKGKHGSDDFRRVLSRCLGDLLYMRWAERNGPEIWTDLLSSPPAQWLHILRANGVDPENDRNEQTDDDPVPHLVHEVLPNLELQGLYEQIKRIPKNQSVNYNARIQEARIALKNELKGLWEECKAKIELQLPLLILDEAHHVKNRDTRLASLFREQGAKDDAETIKQSLAGAFERMLFLTATPFQLGHSELCSVLESFAGINWQSSTAPSGGKEKFVHDLEELRLSLDTAQRSALSLDSAWSLLKPEDLAVGQRQFSDVEEWWQAISATAPTTATAVHVRNCFTIAKEKMKRAEQLLAPWVIRHQKPKNLPNHSSAIFRRALHIGQAIDPDSASEIAGGISISGESLLPFLLATRAAIQAPDSRPVFAEGLASSFEAFLHTRQMREKELDQASVESACDGDDDDSACGTSEAKTKWYLDRLDEIVSQSTARDSLRHPKMAATVRRVLDTWRKGEKAVVFCHYIATGKALRQRISEAIEGEIRRLGAAKLSCKLSEVDETLEKIGDRFFNEDSPVRQACDEEALRMIRAHSCLLPYQDELVKVFRRYMRTPSFLVRFFPLREGRLAPEDMQEAMDRKDKSGLTFRQLLEDFFAFLVNRNEIERKTYIEAVSRIQTGSHHGRDVESAYTRDEYQGMDRKNFVPNVRLVNGSTLQETRQRLMLTFNTPFYPEILVASQVLAEGVDLHLNCRHIIHHDLCWNPSTLEQRNGRVDRIGAKAERCGHPIQIFMPYISETQDEKQYRVVMDRERWFRVVMGEKYKIDLRSTEKLAARIPLPESAADELAFKLEVDPE